MKKIIFFIFFHISFFSVFSQQWGKGYIPHGRNIVDVYIKNTEDIQVVGGSLWNDSIESIFQSYSACQNWEYRNEIPGLSWVVSLDYFSKTSKNGVTVGTNGKIKRTKDGGFYWDYIPSPVSRDYRKVKFTTPSKVIAVGGRQHDTLQTVIVSTDTGQTWSVLRDTAGWKLNSVYFTDPQNGIAVGEHGTILKTSNGGQNWTSITCPVNYDLNEVEFYNSLHGFIVGGLQYNKRTVLFTSDGGATWSVKKDENGPWLNDITFLDSLNGYMVGDNASIFKTVDGGNNWDSINIPVSLNSDLFNTVKFLSPDFGVVGCYGFVYVFANKPTPLVQTTGVTLIDSTKVILSGKINTHNFPGIFTFYLDTTPAFSTPNFWYYPPTFNSNADLIVSGLFDGLVSHKTYYYFVKYANVFGDYFGDTLTFQPTQPSYFFQTQGAIPNGATSQTFQGEVKGLPSSTNLFIDYGSSSNALTQTLVATPSIINDINSHSVTAIATNLLPTTPYYYRLRGETGTKTYLGEIRQVFNGSPYQTLQTTAATNIDINSATINGIIKGGIYHANLTFEYSTNQMWLNSTIVASPAKITDDSLHFITANLTGLLPGTTYYFRVRADFPVIGGFTGVPLSFKTGNHYTAFQTNNVTNVSYNGATLHGELQGLPGVTNLTFEYGTTPTFGSQISANPATVNDTFFHTCSAVLSGLSSNMIYYFRLKGTNFWGPFYGDIKTFYTGGSYIPNWDFQEWQSDSLVLPIGWHILSTNFEQTNGVTGKALKLKGLNLAVLGMVGEGIIPTQAIHHKPDSFSVSLDYDIVQGDTGLMLCALLKGDSLLAYDLHPIVGSSAHSFKKFTYPINYFSPSIPDSFAIGFASTNTMATTSAPNANNYLTIDNIEFSPLLDTVYNGNFEIWKDVVYERANSWSAPPLYYAEDSAALYGIKKVVHIAPDDYAAQINSIHANNHFYSIDLNNAGGSMFGPYYHGYPVILRHQTFNGIYKAFPYTGDTSIISATFYKNGQGVGYADLKVFDTIAAYTPFSIPINYNNSTDIPDSATIFFRSSVKKMNTNGMSILVVDKLNFDGYMPTDIQIVEDKKNKLLLYPNPTNNLLHVEWEEVQLSPISITVFSIEGKQQLVQQLEANILSAVLSLQDLAAGIYWIQINQNGTAQNYKFIKQ